MPVPLLEAEAELQEPLPELGLLLLELSCLEEGSPLLPPLLLGEGLAWPEAWTAGVKGEVEELLLAGAALELEPGEAWHAICCAQAKNWPLSPGTALSSKGDRV